MRDTLLLPVRNPARRETAHGARRQPGTLSAKLIAMNT